MICPGFTEYMNSIKDPLVCLQNLIKKAGVIEEPCNRVINDENFRIWPASCGAHHYHRGGLILHTAEVLSIAQNMASSEAFVGNTDMRVITYAAIFHDWAKVLDYEYKGLVMNRKKKISEHKWSKSVHSAMVHHVVGSDRYWHQCAYELKISPDIINRVSHVILAHHGSKEFGSPVTPQTPDAWIVHLADMASASTSGGTTSKE